MTVTAPRPNPISRQEEWDALLRLHRRVARDFLAAMAIIAPDAPVRIRRWDAERHPLASRPAQDPVGPQPWPLKDSDSTWIIASPAAKPLKVVLAAVRDRPDRHMEARLFSHICRLRRQMERAGLARPDGTALALQPLLVFTGPATSIPDVRLPQFGPEGEIAAWHGVKILQLARHRPGDIPANNLMSTLIPLAQCRQRLREGAGPSVLAQTRRLIQDLKQQAGNDPELAARLQTWMATGLPEPAGNEGTDERPGAREAGLSAVASRLPARETRPDGEPSLPTAGLAR